MILNNNTQGVAKYMREMKVGVNNLAKNLMRTD